MTESIKTTRETYTKLENKLAFAIRVHTNPVEVGAKDLAWLLGWAAKGILSEYPQIEIEQYWTK